MSLGGYRVALRIARRDALRAKGRSLLVLCMIGVPVLAIVALAVLYETSQWSPAERLPARLGRADALLQYAHNHPISQDVYGEFWTSPGEPSENDDPPDTAQIARTATARFGPGARVLPVSVGSAELRTPRGYANLEVREVDLREPATTGMLTLVEGRPPASRDEVTVSLELRDRGYRIGGTIRLTRDDLPKRIVGYATDPVGDPQERFVQTLPDSGLISSEDHQFDWLLVAGRPVTWPDVEHLNRLGLAVVSAELVRNPPSGVGEQASTGYSPESVAVLAMAIAMIVLEVVLLAGPAFAVGIRRQRHRLALVLASGGEPRHLRAIVLAGGLVLGGAAAVLGALGGLGLAAVAVPAIERLADVRMGPYDVPWTLVAATMALGALSGLLAACVPAFQAARMDVVAALAGRREQRRGRSRVGWPVAGAFVIAGGVALCLAGTRIWREFGAAFGAVAIIVGCVMMSPWLVGLAARPARWLPLPLRLAARDSARHRGRSAPAVAAIMAAVAGITVLAIGGASDFAQNRIEYQPVLPMGSASIDAFGEHKERIRRSLQQELPGVPLREVYRITLPDRCTSTTPCQWLALREEDELAPMGDILAVRPDDLRALLGRHDPEAVRILNEGGAIVSRQSFPKASAGSLTARILEQQKTDNPDQVVPGRVVRTVTMPVLALSDPHLVETPAVVSVQTAHRLKLSITLRSYAIDRADHRVTPTEEERVEERIAGVLPEDFSLDFYVERGFTGSFAVPLLLLILAGGVMVFGGSLIVTGLSVADARPDLATLAAVGARPRTRRLLTMSQAACIALLGCWLGIAAGLVPGIAVARPLTITDGSFPGSHAPHTPSHGAIIDIPWLLLAVIGLLVPLLAALAAGLFTRSRLPTLRRVG